MRDADTEYIYQRKERSESNNQTSVLRNFKKRERKLNPCKCNKGTNEDQSGNQ